MSQQDPCQQEAPQFSDKVSDRLSATPTDCSILSSDGLSFAVHKTTLSQQSKVLRQAKACCLATLQVMQVLMAKVDCEEPCRNEQRLQPVQRVAARNEEVQDICLVQEYVK